MANADRCHLTIPWKETAKADLRLDDEGLLESRGLKTFGERMFDNFKAIERRINDTACSTFAISSASFYYGDDVNVTVGGGGSSGNVLLTGWQQRADTGTGGTWALASDFLTVPQGTYLVSAWCEVFGPDFTAATDVAEVDLAITGPNDAVRSSSPRRDDDIRTFWLSCSGPINVSDAAGGDISLTLRAQGTAGYTFVAESNRMLTVQQLGTAVAAAI